MLIIIVGGTVFAYVKNIGPFAMETYTEENLMSGLAQTFAGITSAEAKFLVDAQFEEREADAKVYTPAGRSETLVEDYKNDHKRVEALKEFIWNVSYSGAEVYSEEGFDLYYLERSDPEFEFEYQVTEEGKNFTITTEFLTTEVIDELKKTLTEDVVFEGKKITLTKNSDTFFWVPMSLPMSPFEQMSELISSLSPQFTTYGSISLTTNWLDVQNTEGLLRLEGEADLGDLTFKVDLEGRKKGPRFFGRINNLPEIPFISGFLPEKGKWLYFDLEEESDIVTMSTGADSETISAEIEKQKKNAAEIALKAIKLSDKHRVFRFKDTPYVETINEEKLMRYDLDIDREALIRMYTDLRLEIEALEGAEDLKEIIDTFDFLTSAESEEFISSFDYFKENYNFVLWTDEEQRPVRVELSGRTIPTESATRLEGQQLRTKFTILLNNVNEPVVVEAPEGAESVDSFVESIFGESLTSARTKGQNANIKALVSGVRAQAELFYSDNDQSYGATGLSCTTENSLFTDAFISETITSVDADNGPGSVLCANTATSWILYSPLSEDTGSGEGYCVDSTGFGGDIIVTSERLSAIESTDLCESLI